MFSLMEQLALANGAAMPPAKGRQGYGTRHNMIGSEIDAIVLKIVEREPGLLASEIFERVTHPGLTQTSVIESLRRLYDAKKVHQVQRVKQDKARYWPRAMIAEASAYREQLMPDSLEDRIYQLLADGEGLGGESRAAEWPWAIGGGLVENEGGLKMTLFDFINESPYIAAGFLMLLLFGIESIIDTWRRK